MQIWAYGDMQLEGIRFRADFILDLWRLGIFSPVVVSTSYAARHRLFRLGVC